MSAVPGEVHSALFRNIIAVLLFHYGILALFYFTGDVLIFLKTSFQYQNETSVLIIIALLMLSSLVATLLALKPSPHATHLLVLALVLAQSSAVLAVGYNHGKAVFNGVIDVHLLDNREVCEKEGSKAWIFLGRFSNLSIFMNEADKRLCITEEKNYRLVSRMFAEKEMTLQSTLSKENRIE